MQSSLPTQDVEAAQSADSIVVDIEAVANAGKLPHIPDDPGIVVRFLIKIDETTYETKNRKMTRDQILALNGKDGEDFDLFQIVRAGSKSKEELVGPNDKVDFGNYGIERFVTRPKIYPFSIGKMEYKTREKFLTVRQILVDHAKVNPADKTLAQKEAGGFREYKDLDEKVSMQGHPKFTLFDNTPTQVS